ncbi:hypothetical protein M427DRAFT_27666 [Gonapodya prolifera JEL478]|uniref:Uncharacterized protein n=1 Tax=Gonapodya prolifera (strain JEL478) TaxID=1344416 RepID=A0A139AX01_GONPJ|nr:hypothetical protein M427DRAFT_27666 [Gonapodya prolifera JEL478]|eukprot:KXS21248.1 hypothetical protein M427DRAFT_27666 [Gonapodya prolifera JEL478]
MKAIWTSNTSAVPASPLPIFLKALAVVAIGSLGGSYLEQHVRLARKEQRLKELLNEEVRLNAQLHNPITSESEKHTGTK